MQVRKTGDCHERTPKANSGEAQRKRPGKCPVFREYKN